MTSVYTSLTVLHSAPHGAWLRGRRSCVSATRVRHGSVDSPVRPVPPSVYNGPSSSADSGVRAQRGLTLAGHIQNPDHTSNQPRTTACASSRSPVAIPPPPSARVCRLARARGQERPGPLPRPPAGGTRRCAGRSASRRRADYRISGAPPRTTCTHGRSLEGVTAVIVTMYWAWSPAQVLQATGQVRTDTARLTPYGRSCRGGSGCRGGATGDRNWLLPLRHMHIISTWDR